jgi:DNA-binding MarR family transcriptional regulator
MADISDPNLIAAVTALRELVLAGEKYRQIASAYLQVDVGQAQAISYLYSRGAMGQSELGALLGFNTSSVTALVDRLERDDIARRLPHPTDRRRSRVELTDHGRAAVNRLGPWFAGAFKNVDPSALPEATAVLAAIAADLRSQAANLAGQPALDPGALSG